MVDEERATSGRTALQDAGALDFIIVGCERAAIEGALQIDELLPRRRLDLGRLSRTADDNAASEKEDAQ